MTQFDRWMSVVRETTFNTSPEVKMIASPFNDWTQRVVELDPKLNPDGKRVFLDRQIFDAARQGLVIACHDSVVVRKRGGHYQVLLVIRREPGNWMEGEAETAPINDWLWLIGGRHVLYAGEHFASAPERSLLLKLRQEIGHHALENLVGVWRLGLGTTFFPQQMTYGSTVKDMQREAVLSSPAYTMNETFVVEVAGETEIAADSSLRDPFWVSREQWEGNVAQYASEYLRTFVTTTFAGLEQK